MLSNHSYCSCVLFKLPLSGKCERKTETLTLSIKIDNNPITLTLGVMDVILVIVGATGMHLASLDHLDRVVLTVPPTAHHASTHLQRLYTRLPLLRRVGFRRGHFRYMWRHSVDRKLRLLVTVTRGVGGGGRSCRAVFLMRWRLYGTHSRFEPLRFHWASDRNLRDGTWAFGPIVTYTKY